MKSETKLGLAEAAIIAGKCVISLLPIPGAGVVAELAGGVVPNPRVASLEKRVEKLESGSAVATVYPTAPSQPVLPSGRYELEVGVLWSNECHIQVAIDKVVFSGRLLGETHHGYNNRNTRQQLYQTVSGQYLIYEAYVQNINYSKATLYGVEEVITVEYLQAKFPALATEAGLWRVVELN